MVTTRETGSVGESIAADFLIAEGYKILHKNWNAHHAEIDIVASQENVIVFVEVKLLSDFSHRRPEEAVTVKKARLLIRAAEAYMQRYFPENPFRFDVVSITKSLEKQTITHLEDIINPWDY